MITASVCTIGDEILIGQIVDTNSSMIARALGSIGVRVTRMVSIGDSRQEILGTLSKELEINDIVITTGGLGPTKDDITKGVLAELFGCEGYLEHPGQMEMVYSILHSRGLEVLDVNKAQALVPKGCDVIVNRRGTAPIMVFRNGNSTLYAMPGVPFETEAALGDVLADIAEHQSLTAISHRHLMTYGLAESALAKKIASWEDALPPDMHLAYLPSPLAGVKLRLSIYGGDAAQNERRFDKAVEGLKALIGEYIYAYGEESLEEVLGAVLRAKGKTVSAAESCTGGEIAHLITTVPGSSDYFLGSVTSYAISVKENVLGVKPETIRDNGVVSAEVASEMALGVLNLTGGDYAVATTGLAGPGGGDGVNPDGTVWVAVASKTAVLTRKFQYKNDRKHNIERFAASALHFLLTFVNSDATA